MNQKFSLFLLLIFLYLLLTARVTAQSSMPQITSLNDSLEKGFIQPPDTARPFVYWYWINQNISKEGITADLEAMKRVGIGGALIIQAGLPPKGPVPFLSQTFNQMIGHALSEASRLGLRISINNGDGWSGSGGPWIKPEHAMKELTWSLSRYKAPDKAPITLPTPFHRHKFYRDIAVIAFPVTAYERNELSNKALITTNAGELDNTLVSDDDTYTADTLYPKPDQPLLFNFQFPEPFTARSLTVGFSAPIYRALPQRGILQVSQNGNDFTDHKEIILGWRTNLPTATVTFEEVTAKYFRLYIPPFQANSELFVSDLSLHATQRINYWQAKAGYSIKAEQHHDRPFLYAANDSFATHTPSFIHPDSILVLTGKMDKNGTLHWKAPKGQWNILRIGYTTTGQLNAPSTPAGEGLECDKLNPIGIETHFPHVLGKFLDMYDTYHPRPFFATHTDSWEYNNQNWTEILREEFRKRRRYDLLPYIAALTGGYQIGSKEITERFLRDFRITLSELITENYFTRFRDLCAENGLVLSGEGSGGDQFLYQGFSYQAPLRVPMGEFWVNAGHIYPECKSAASAAHIFNKTLVGAEAFTSGAPASKWLSHPYSLKSLGDQAFCTGVNWLWLHTFVHQPRPDVKPGLTLGGWGTHFEHTNTWFEQSKPWFDYLTRCQFMLQQGRFQADILCLMREDIPSSVKTREELGIPAGYDYDVCDKNVLLNHLDVADGKFVTSGGMQYRLLLLPDEQQMSLEVLQKIAVLVQKGGHVAGARRISSNSLTHYPLADKQVEQLAGRLWAKEPGNAAAENSSGEGKVHAGKPLQQILGELGLPPDFTYTTNDTAHLRFIHRKQPQADVYFIANSDYKEVNAQCSFRIKGRMPEIWYPDEGRIQKILAFKQTPDGITIPLHFGPAASYFIVFREQIPDRFITAVEADGKTLFNNQIHLQRGSAGKYHISSDAASRFTIRYSDGTVAKVKGAAALFEKKLTGSWRVTFPALQGAPPSLILDSLYSLHQHTQAGVRYFSGSATYTKTFDLAKRDILKNTGQLYLDLGEIAVIASIKVNGKEAGTVWKKPYRADITALVKPGKNELEIVVSNLWTNRLIGDENYPAEAKYLSWGPMVEMPGWYWQGKPRPQSQRIGFVTHKIVSKEDPLPVSGLLGPVRLIWKSEVEWKVR